MKISHAMFAGVFERLENIVIMSYYILAVLSTKTVQANKGVRRWEI